MLPRFVRPGVRCLQPARSLVIHARPSIVKPARRVQAPAVYQLSRYSAVSSAKNMEEAMNNIEELFSAAKDEMEYAQETIGSVYYHEDRVTAENAVKQCLEAFDNFLKDLPSDEMRNEVQNKVGMKIKELKMEFEALPEEGD